MLGAIFDAFIGGLEGICDILEFGPVEAFRINTAGCPEGERAQRRVEEHFKQYNKKIEEPEIISDALDNEEDYEAWLNEPASEAMINRTRDLFHSLASFTADLNKIAMDSYHLNKSSYVLDDEEYEDDENIE